MFKSESDNTALPFKTLRKVINYTERIIVLLEKQYGY